MSRRMIDIPPLYKYSFTQLRKYASFIIGITVTYFVLAIVPQLYYALYEPELHTLGSQLVSLMFSLLQILLTLGFIKVMLYLVDGRPVQVSDLFNNVPFFFHYFVASVLYGLAVLIGTFLLIIPGIYLALRLQFYAYYILEENATSIAALKMSFDATENLTAELFLFAITAVLINLAGLLFFGFGILVTYPVTTMATAVIFKGLAQDARHLPTKSYYL